MQIKRDSGWLETSQSKPRRGWYVYERLIILDERLDEQGIKEFCATLLQKGQSPVRHMHQIVNVSGYENYFQSTLDSGD